MSIDPSIIKEATALLEKKVHQECEDAFNQWRDRIIFSCSRGDFPDGLMEKLDQFCLSQKHLFFRGFKEKIIYSLKERIQKQNNTEKLLVPYGKEIDSQKMFIGGVKFSDQKDRTFLEAYFINNENSRKAADFLGIAKSTFHDWKVKNQELINSERNK